jgi:hypothetical protein
MPCINLSDYQLEAVKNMKNGCILCGGVGSGKSRTSSAYYFITNGGDITDDEYSPMDDPPDDLYIITTARKRDMCEWEGELAPFLISKNPEIDLYQHTVVIDSWNNIKKYKDVRGAFFIFDEQRVIGSGAWVKAFLKITKVNKWILLSATPGDTWQDYIPVFIANGFFRNRSEFIEQHVVYSRVSKFPKIDRYLNVGKLIRLRDSILVNMDYTKKTVVHHEDVIVDYDIQTYKATSKNRWDPYRNEPIMNAGGLCYVFNERGRVIIFYNFDYELDILRGLDYGEGVEVAEWNGHNHQPLPNCAKWVYLVQYTAGCEGWNCIKTDTIIFYSQNYSYKVMVQAAGRTDRLNTPYTDLYYYHLKSKSSIDLAIGRALNNKKNFNENKFVRW